jgi:hypothetical protein
MFNSHQKHRSNASCPMPEIYILSNRKKNCHQTVKFVMRVNTHNIVTVEDGATFPDQFQINARRWPTALCLKRSRNKIFMELKLLEHI